MCEFMQIQFQALADAIDWKHLEKELASKHFRDGISRIEGCDWLDQLVSYQYYKITMKKYHFKKEQKYVKIFIIFQQ